MCLHTDQNLMAEFRQQALDDGIPIIGEEAWELLRRCVRDINPHNVLEIGTAIGYSATKILNECKCHLVSIEIDSERHAKAVQNLAKYCPDSNYELILGDAKQVLKQLIEKGNKFELIFLDGPKGQYINYYPLVKQLLTVGGVLFCDNVFFHGLAKGDSLPPPKNRTMLMNLRKFLTAVNTDEDMRVEITEGDEAVAICSKLR